MKRNIVYPDYENSILNLITSILKYYDVESNHTSLEILDKVLEEKFKNIVLIILDGMGNNLLKEISPNNFFSKNKLDTITSVYPCTTVAALNTYYSGKAPIETGFIAFTQYFKEYGRSLYMFSHKDAYTEETYPNAKTDVFEQLKYKNIFEKIEKKKINAYEINPPHCDTRSRKYQKASDVKTMCNTIKNICKNEEDNFVLAYYDAPDNILHRHGCSSKEVKKFILESEKTIEDMTEALKGTNTLVIVCADHGHNDIKKTYTIKDLECINDYLIMPPGLESRVVSFWVKEDKKKDFEKAFNNKFKDEFMLITKEDFLNKHFLGYGKQHKKVDDFLGNYLALSIADSIIKIETQISKPKYQKKSTHCGLTENEMLVPLIVKKIQ